MNIITSKKGIAINCKKIEWMVTSKRDSERCELRSGDARIKQKQKVSPNIKCYN